MPEFEVGAAGFGGSPFVTVTHGGQQQYNTAKSLAEQLSTVAHHADRAAAIAGLIASFRRRKEDWDFQADVAQKDLESLDRQIVAAQLRVAIAERELANLDLQVAQSREIDEHLRTKFTNEQLYGWMVGQLSSLYFQSYQLAFEVARRAERAWQHELARPDAGFIQYGYWDSLKKGLLAGERLSHDLRRMEVAYLDQHRREYELTHHVSLRLLDPLALERLRAEGECFVRVPEVWFDLDGPGHYLRRLKNVAVSIPSVTGPYVPVRCTLTLVASSVRVSPDASGAYPRSSASDPRFRDEAVGLTSIVTSRAQEDAGLFEVSLRDERYLPFEGAGAISEWRIELPRTFRQFDYATISDVVLHLRYTARDGGEPLRTAASESIRSALTSLVLGSQDARPSGGREGLLHRISLREELPDRLHQFLHPAPEQLGQSVTVAIERGHLPHGMQIGEITVLGLDVLLPVADPASYRSGPPVRLRLVAPGRPPQTLELVSDRATVGGIPHATVALAGGASLGEWTLELREEDNAAGAIVVDVDGHRRLAASAIEDVVFVVRYRVGA